MKGYILALLVTFTVSAANAADEKITKLHFYKGHTGIFVTTNNIIDNGCQRKEYYILANNHPYFKEVYALILAAHISGQPLNIVPVGCHENFNSIAHVFSSK